MTNELLLNIISKLKDNNSIDFKQVTPLLKGMLSDKK